MTFAERFRIALRYTFATRRGYLSTFLSALSMLGLVLAISLLIVVLSVMNGFDKEMRERILALVPHVTLFAREPIRDYAADLELLRAHPDVTSAAPFVNFDALVKRGTLIDTAQGVGLAGDAGPQAGQLQEYLAQGDMIDFSSPDAGSGVVLGSALARRLQAETGALLTLIVPGQTRARGISRPRFETVRLTGIVRTGTELDEALLLVPLSMASDLAGMSGSISGFRITTSALFDARKTGWELSDVLAPDYYASNWMMTQGNLYSAIQLSRDLVSILLFSIIAVAAFNVVSSLVLVVMDKRGSIAILRTLGARASDIAWIFILQGGLIGLVGVVLGGLLGALGSGQIPALVAWLERILGMQFLSTDVYPVSFVPVDVRWTDIASVGAVAFLMCLLAALYPARRAAKMAPAQVLNQDR